MGAAVVVIPLAALALPIVLILSAILVDIVGAIWALYRMWHDEWSEQIGHYLGDHLVRPVARYARAHGVAGHRPAGLSRA